MGDVCECDNGGPLGWIKPRRTKKSFDSLEIGQWLNPT
jgi:hypothetical protein